MKKKQKSSRATRVPRPKRVNETATIDRVRRKAELDIRRHGTKSIVCTDGDDYVHSEQFGRVKREYLPDGRPAASNCGGSAKRSGSKFLALVRNMALGFPDEVGGPILDPGLGKLTPRVIGAIRNLENAAQILCATDPDYRSVREKFTLMRLGKSSKSMQATVRQSVIDAIHTSGTKSASDSIRIADAMEDNERSPIEVSELGGIIGSAASLGASLGAQTLSTPSGQRALVKFTAGVVGGLIDAGCVKTSSDVQGWSTFVSSVAVFGSKLGADVLASPAGQDALSRFASELLRALAEGDDEAA